MIKSGGWTVGGNYRYYREHGWGPAGALFMTTPTITLWVVCGVIGLLIGWFLAYFATRGM